MNIVKTKIGKKMDISIIDLLVRDIVYGVMSGERVPEHLKRANSSTLSYVYANTRAPARISCKFLGGSGHKSHCVLPLNAFCPADELKFMKVLFNI